MKLNTTQETLLSYFTTEYRDHLAFSLLFYGRMRTMNDFLERSGLVKEFYNESDIYIFFKDDNLKKYEGDYSFSEPDRVPDAVKGAEIRQFSTTFCYLGFELDITIYPNGDSGYSSSSFILVGLDTEPAYDFDYIFDYLQIDLQEYPEAYSEIKDMLVEMSVEVAEDVEEILKKELEDLQHAAQ